MVFRATKKPELLGTSLFVKHQQIQALNFMKGYRPLINSCAPPSGRETAFCAFAEGGVFVESRKKSGYYPCSAPSRTK
jgi:hypothetical protein